MLHLIKLLTIVYATRIIREDFYRRFHESGQISIVPLPYMQPTHILSPSVLPLENFTDLVNSKNKDIDENTDSDIILRMNLLFH
jgi:hypothetical protein